MTPSFEEIREAFSLFEGWEERYAYLIELGQNLPPFPLEEMTDKNKVEGCMSQVWLTAREENGRFFLNATSDAILVKGLIALILSLYNEKTPREILSVHIEEIFKELGLEDNLSPSRRNGFFSMVAKIQALAEKRENLPENG